MDRLTEKEWWDCLYRNKKEIPKTESTACGTSKYFNSYYEHFLLNVLLKKYMPKTEGSKILEIGSAPGEFLVRVHQIYGLVPFGVEYSEAGVIKNRELFILHNIDPAHVIHADFFDNKFQDEFKEYFDIVISRGFIEHFVDVKSVIERHLNMLKKGGCLIVSIPNLSEHSLYGKLSSLFDKERLQMHNLHIMSKDKFTALFNRADLSPLFCNYFGTIELGIISKGHNPRVRPIVVGCWRLQRLLNVLLHSLLRGHGIESRFFSPMLIYIGTKKIN